MSSLEKLNTQILKLGLTRAEVGRYGLQQQTFERKDRVLIREGRKMKGKHERERKV